VMSRGVFMVKSVTNRVSGESDTSLGAWGIWWEVSMNDAKCCVMLMPLGSGFS
jgi:hypothetical protein